MAAPTLQLKVVRVSQLTLDVASFRLEHPEGLPLPAFAAGAHIEVHLPNDVIRQYSLCNHPADADHYLIAVKREPDSRGGSSAMHDVSAGSLLSIGSPRNNFLISDEANFHLLLAGGIGVTPILSMARQLQRDNKPFHIEYFSRSIESMPFHNVISDEMGAHAGFNVGLEPNDVRERLVGILRDRPASAHAYVCGPVAFMDMATEIASLNWPTESIHLEHFSPQPVLRQGENRPFRVTLAQSNQQFDIPADKSILDVLRENRIPCDSSCREGVCGSCMVAVLEGEVDHRDSYLSADEKQQGEVMMICVSRAKNGDLTIDM
jgi:vanillate O-demethylase ferredoxin subunit